MSLVSSLRRSGFLEKGSAELYWLLAGSSRETAGAKRIPLSHAAAFELTTATAKR
jgi:hypothetical protein